MPKPISSRRRAAPPAVKPRSRVLPRSKDTVASVLQDIRDITEGLERLRAERAETDEAIRRIEDIRLNALTRLIEVEDQSGMSDAQREPIHAQVRQILGVQHAA